MRAHIAIGLVVLGLAAAGPALGSASASGSLAALVTPAPRAITVLDGRVWRCAGKICSAGGKGRSQSLARECARAARKLGQLTAYSRNGKALDKAALKVCNRR